MRCIAHSLSIFLTLGVATGFPTSASADDAPPKAQQTSRSLPAPPMFPPKAGPNDSSSVKDHVRRAQRARNAGRWSEAYAAYKAAFDAADPTTSTERERAEIAGELGLCEVALHNYRDAAEHLAKSLEQREALPDALERRFQAGQREAVKRVATLVLSVDPPDAEVLIDGERIGRTARTYTLFFEPGGKHMVRSRAPGHADAFQGFLGVAGVEHEMTMELPRAAASSAKEASSAKDTAPATPTPLRPLPATRAQAPSPWASWPGTLRITGIAVTTAGVTVGTILMVQAGKLDDDLSARRDRLQSEPSSSTSMCWHAPRNSPCGELARLQDARNMFGRAGLATVITGGVVGAVTAASFFTDFSFLRFKPAQDRVNVSPVANGNEIGARIEGVW
ncbi:PEGA domain-containing protein [Sorangium sp. So ce367]|uniref:PEGA domain-containing protein n=1 Tax=Sorangium sp. So ce367 TaxID=3133305 RepID=UPI003F5E243E